MNRDERNVGLAGLALIAAIACVRGVGGLISSHAAWAWQNRPWFGRWRRHHRKPKGPA